MHEQDASPLSRLPEGTCGVVSALAGGGSFCQRLASMGLGIGCKLEVLRGGTGGPVMVLVGGARVAIGCGMADRILVTVDASAAGGAG